MKALITLSFLALAVSAAEASPFPKNNKIVSSAKFNDEFVRFNAHRQQNGIALTWTFTNANNAVAFVIERSYDGTFFENIAELPTGNGTRCQYRDNAVYPGYSHYRVGALMYDGSVIYSKVEVVRIVRNG